ncbi:NAD-dependent protein deacetylase [Alkalilimnicola ehrlichii]|uniref:NAD-dependent protein deacetylase n=1 Tax=Alkalilimnicola ehrlichii TaxID=351052 RepID=UPI003BA040AC
MSAAVPIRMPDVRRWPEVDVPVADAGALAAFLLRHPRTLVLTGAGISTGSGIPAYRDREGRWVHRQPMQYQAFMGSDRLRRRYWARSYLGWPRMQQARPNPAHSALASLQQAGHLGGLVTQNVDRLHHKAGSPSVTELHGTLSEVVCQDCGRREPRESLQAELSALNPGWVAAVHGLNPDGDAELDEDVYDDFRIAHCHGCGGVLKPDVVFFGESVPSARVTAVRAALAISDAVLVVGSSLVVWSGYRFAREAAAQGKPVVAINQGRTRADGLLRFKVEAPCDAVLPAVAQQLSRG